MAPFTKRPTPARPGASGGAQQLVRCWVEVAGSYDGEDHAVGEFIYLDEIHAHVLQRKRKVRICTAEETQVVARADQLRSARARAIPHLSLGMGL